MRNSEQLVIIGCVQAEQSPRIDKLCSPHLALVLLSGFSLRGGQNCGGGGQMTTLSPELWSPHVWHPHHLTSGVLCVSQDILLLSLTLIWVFFFFFLPSHFYNSKEKESLKMGEEKEPIPLED